MGAFNQLNGAIFDAAAIEARISAVDGKSIYNQRDGGILDFDSLARRLTALDGKIAVGQGGIEFDVDSFMRRLAAIEAGAFTPLQLFAAGEQGAWYDPSDFSTLFQDSAGTTPVTALGQPVGLVLDKSGRANHLSQATTTSRPIVQQDAGGFFYLLGDGVDDFVKTAGPIGLSSPTFFWSIGLYLNSLPTAGYLWFASRYHSSSRTSTFRFTSNGVKDYDDTTYGMAATTPTVVGGVYDAAFSFTPRKNGVARSAITGTADSAASETALSLLADNAGVSPSPARLYQFVVRKAATDPTTMSNVDRFIGAKMGLAL